MARSVKRREPTMGAHEGYRGEHRAYVCEHGVVQSTCRCAVSKAEILVSCGTACPGRAKKRGRKRA